MLVIPAIDLRGGKCVRLQQGAFDAQKVYSENPVDMAGKFAQCGAQKLHLIDLDGAQTGKALNVEVVKKIVTECGLPVQLGGGIRSFEAIRYWLELGLQNVIVSTMAFRKAAEFEKALTRFSGEIILAVDARDGEVMIDGWQQGTGMTATDLALQFKPAGLCRLLYTDISRDGMFTGPNAEQTKKIAESTGLKVTASGGVSSIEDIERLSGLVPFGVDSVVVGKAFYEGKIKPEDIFRVS